MKHAEHKWLSMAIALILIVILPACKSKKGCATFEDPNKNYHVKYNKKGLIKK
jgi:uncharacterized lipoprotein YehR (DUF1307 family)